MTVKPFGFISQVPDILSILNFFLSLFIYFEREKERMSRRGVERGRKRIPGRLYVVSTEPDAGLELTNHVIMT